MKQQCIMLINASLPLYVVHGELVLSAVTSHLMVGGSNLASVLCECSLESSS